MIGLRSAVLIIAGRIAINFFFKCFTVHAEHFVVRGSVLPSKLLHQFLHSAFVSPFDPFPCPSSPPPTLSRFIFCTFLQQIDYQKTSCSPLSSRKIHTFTSLSHGTVHIFTRKEPHCYRDFPCAISIYHTSEKYFSRAQIG